MNFAKIVSEYVMRDSPLRELMRYAREGAPFLTAVTLVRAYYFFLLFLSVGLYSWDPSFGPQTGIERPWSVEWISLVGFGTAYTVIRIAFIASSILVAFMPQMRIARILSFVAFLEFVSLYVAILQLDVDGYGLLLVSFIFIFLPHNWNADAPVVDKMQALAVFWGAIAISLLTYTMVGIGKLFGAMQQIMAGQSHFFTPEAPALHIASRLLLTDTVTPLGAWAVEHYFLVFPYFLFTLYFCLFAFLVAFRPALHRTWGLLLILFHFGNYMTINIAFIGHWFLWAMLLFASPFAPAKITLREIVRELPLIDIAIRYHRAWNVRIGVAVALLLVAGFAVATSLPSRYVLETITLERIGRDYLLHAPASLPRKALPLVIALHGGGGPLGSAELMAASSGWKELSQREYFIVAFPQGLLEHPSEPIHLTDDVTDTSRNIRSWNDGSGRTPAARRGAADTAYIEAMLQDIETRYPVDRSRIYVTGFSNGATMTYHLGMELSHSLSAIAPVAGLLYTDKMELPSPVSLLHISGDSDARPVNASSAASDPVETWRRFMNCTKEKLEQAPRLTMRTYRLCDEGTEVTQITITGAGHSYPRDPTFDATHSIWMFFTSQHKYELAR